jgi:hypothetical protein
VFTRQKLLNLVTLVRHYKSELIIGALIKYLEFMTDFSLKYDLEFDSPHLPGDQEGLFKLAIQLRKFFNCVII